MYPPVPEKLDDLFQLGFKDTEDWLRKHRHRLKAPQPIRNGTQHAADQAASETKSQQASHVQGSMFGQFACQAPSCDESLKEVAVGRLIKLSKQSRDLSCRSTPAWCKQPTYSIHD